VADRLTVGVAARLSRYLQVLTQAKKMGKSVVVVLCGRNIAADVSLRGLPRGRFTLRVVARTASGRVVQRDRHYVTCVRDKSAS